jgi:hypothetical protein
MRNDKLRGDRHNAHTLNNQITRLPDLRTQLAVLNLTPPNRYVFLFSRAKPKWRIFARRRKAKELHQRRGAQTDLALPDPNLTVERLNLGRKRLKARAKNAFK